jgi:hypothetical protein
MDDLGICDLEDASRIAAELRAGHNVLFGFRRDQEGEYTVLIGPPATIVGKLPYSGQAYGRYLVGVIYVGLFHFTLDEGPVYSTYVCEKLRMESGDAVALTYLLNAIREELIRS